MRAAERSATFAAAILALLPACGGDRGEAPAGGRSAQGTPESSSCTTAAVTVARACILQVMRANAPLRVVASAGECARSCEGTTTTPSCAARVEGDTVVLEMSARTCVDARESRRCTEDCDRREVECSVPPLAAGTYRVIGVSTPSAGAPPLDRTLVVRDDSEATQCLVARGPAIDPAGR